jgi:FdhD protein
VKRNILTVPVRKHQGGSQHAEQDLIAVEEPLEILVNGRNLAITMRTPGNDEELTAGFLFTEGLLHSPSAIQEIVAAENRVDLRLREDSDADLSRLQRNFYLTSSCGVCGKASLDALENIGCEIRPQQGLRISSEVLLSLPAKLRAAQAAFERTGGIHAAGLFDVEGNLLLSREDVGRHNAVDKLVGRMFLDGKLPLENCVLMLSGRTSFELMQKSLMAGVPALAAVGAPSSLAVQVALRFGMTLIGFLRDGRFNVYSGDARVVG